MAYPPAQSDADLMARGDVGGAIGFVISGLSDGFPVRPIVLSTKLRVPQFWRKLVPRPRLTSLLGKITEHALTLVCAPAGYGKTTLLSEWAATCSLPIGWVSLDNSENDLSRFWSYLIAALQTLKSCLGKRCWIWMQLAIRRDLRAGQAGGVERNRWPIADMREPFSRRYFVVYRNAKDGAG